MENIVKEEEVFFETVDYISVSSETDDESEEFFFSKSEYEIWISEPQSARERRETFTQGVGMAETSSDTEATLESTKEYRYNKESSFDAQDSSCPHENPSCSNELQTGDEGITYSESLEPDKADLASTNSSERVPEALSFMLESEREEGDDHSVKHNIDSTNKKKRNWLNLLLAKTTKKGTKLKPSQMKVSPELKRCIGFSAVYVRQKIKAHSGCITVMKISPDGQYLASGGEDGVIRIWLITSANGKEVKAGKLTYGSSHVVIPQKLFHIEHYPLYEYFGHSGCVVDLAWSKSSYLVSSSEDGTARLWQIGRNNCLNVFHHTNPVTCVQFNPVDDEYFISGSTDGKVRIWGTFKGRVTDWIGIREAVTAICYQPDGTGFIVGSSSGVCRFYGYSGDDLRHQLEAQVHVHGKKKTPSNKITGIEFSPDEMQRIMITSNDSAVRILDGVNVVQKYKGLRKSSTHLSASFTSTGQHMISLDASSRIYMWKYDGTPTPSFRKSSTNSCEHFLFRDISVAIPWSPMQRDGTCTFSSDVGQVQDPWTYSGGSCHPIAGDYTTCLEDLPSSDWYVPKVKRPSVSKHSSFPTECVKRSALSETWGLVIVTGSKDGVIRTFHNYGFPAEIGSGPQLIQSISH